ncbi:hypothetical protein ABER61_00995 [Brevibacillus formosus]|uniref:Uncharacterized protein n=1 Tax=Brevibacillus formosus TaxID=54913 RepID=A0ABQ0TEL0_9BACL|nr:hypothetical protein [Brevibacillus formosus]MED1960208.1 hypothetical protein [Brevibacillus formosus]PSJ99366.1 hypothetical protein C7R91_03770 [Brevibacillus formosus]GED59678.1 hypothetical protein BFO01nite_38100 [Brevibacillus formosus]
MTGYERIRVTAPYRIKQIEDIQLEWRPNEHAWLHLRGIVDDSEKVNAVLQAASEDEIHLYESDGETEATIFKGLVTSVQITNTQGVYTIELEGLSGSFQLDIKKKRRSFQQIDMTYPKLVQEVIKSYPGHNMINSIGDGVKIGEVIIQYDETDWELLKRLASHFHGVLVSDIMEATPRFSFGLTYGKSYTLPDDVSYTASKDLLAYQKAGGDAADLHDTDFFTYEIESGERYAIGDEIQFRNKRMVVSAVSARMQQGLFRYTYRLSRLDGIRQERIHNSKLSGVSLEGKVLAVKGEQVKLHLDIDKEQSKDTACWVPFAPPTGNMMYCMPQVGTQASLYFPDATGKQAMVLGSVRKNGDSCAKTSNPNIRYFGTEHGSELELSPTAINIVSGNKEPLKLTFDDKVGITMTSHKKLVMNAKEEISLYTPKRIVIQAQSQFFAKKTRAKSGFTIESEYHFLGAVVQAEGRDRTTFPPYNDEPQKGTPPPPDPPFNWGKLLVGVVAAVAIVGFVALSVATFGAGAVIGAAAVGAALGAIGGVVATASSDIANGKMSSLYDYGKSAAQGAVIGAICGAIFGPAAGIGGGAVIPMTGGQTTLSLGSGMFIGGSSGYIDYVGRELWDGRTPDAGKALESFAFGAVLGGGFTLGASWLSQGLSKIKGMGKGGAAPKSEVPSDAGGVSAGQAIFESPDFRYFNNVSNRKDIDPDGFFDVIAHGSPKKIQIQTSRGTILVDHRVAARLIQQSPGYKGQNIRLLSCETGMSYQGFAQNLANKLNVEVKAPNNTIWAYPDGTIVVAPRMVLNPNLPDLSKTGKFTTFKPGYK